MHLIVADIAPIHGSTLFLCFALWLGGDICLGLFLLVRLHPFKLLYSALINIEQKLKFY